MQFVDYVPGPQLYSAQGLQRNLKRFGKILAYLFKVCQLLSYNQQTTNVVQGYLRLTTNPSPKSV